MVKAYIRCGFQPTRPVRGVTYSGCSFIPHLIMFQPTRPVRGVTGKGYIINGIRSVSTHTPRAGRDLTLLFVQPVECTFQPTRPVRGVTK